MDKKVMLESKKSTMHRWNCAIAVYNDQGFIEERGEALSAHQKQCNFFKDLKCLRLSL